MDIAWPRGTEYRSPHRLLGTPPLFVLLPKQREKINWLKLSAELKLNSLKISPKFLRLASSRPASGTVPFKILQESHKRVANVVA